MSCRPVTRSANQKSEAGEMQPASCVLADDEVGVGHPQLPQAVLLGANFTCTIRHPHSDPFTHIARIEEAPPFDSCSIACLSRSHSYIACAPLLPRRPAHPSPWPRSTHPATAQTSRGATRTSSTLRCPPACRPARQHMANGPSSPWLPH
jgi:hypothetical protein